MTAAHIAAVLFLACAWMLAAILVALVVGPYLRRCRDEADAVRASGDDERVRQMIAYHNAYRAAVAEDAGNEAAWDQAVALGNSHVQLPADPAAPVYTDLLADYEAARADWTEPNSWGDYHQGGPA